MTGLIVDSDYVEQIKKHIVVYWDKDGSGKDPLGFFIGLRNLIIPSFLLWYSIIYLLFFIFNQILGE